MDASTVTELDHDIGHDIGQLFAVGFPGTEPTPDVLDLIQRQGVGSIILFSRNLTNAEQTLRLTTALQAAARQAGHLYPLLIMTDQENGLVRRLGRGATVFPGNMALGAVGSDELVYAVARATGIELRTLGISMNLAPVVDINSNPLNPVIGIRSFGEDPDLVARLGAAAVRGYRDAGVIATLKHFPGHGDTATDSHLAMPELPFSRERLEQVELVPFRHGIAAGAEVVLTGHIWLPTLVPGEPRPASLAPEIVQGLLREQLGFDGVVITDCLEMDAVAATVGVARGVVLALQAGSDLALISHRADRQYAALEAVRQAVRSGELRAEAVRAAVEQVRRLKQRLLTWDAPSTGDALAVVGSPEHRTLSEHAYTSAVTLVRDDARALPLRLDAPARILVVARPMTAITQASDIAYSHEDLVEAIRRRHPNVEMRLLSAASAAEDERDAIAAARAADMVLLVTLNAHRDPDQFRFLRAVADAATRTVGLAVYDPYDAGALARVPTFLATYEYSQAALEAAARVLFGEAAPGGRLPVSLVAATPDAAS